MHAGPPREHSWHRAGARAARIGAAVELGRRTLSAPAITRPKFQSPREIAKYAVAAVSARTRSSGSASCCWIAVPADRHPDLSTGIARLEPRASARGLPRSAGRRSRGPRRISQPSSGDPRPSQEDLALTHRLKHAGLLLGVDLRGPPHPRRCAILFDEGVTTALMARILYLDCFSGAAGDMLLGAPHRCRPAGRRAPAGARQPRGRPRTAA